MDATANRHSVRPAAVAGLFYPGDPESLTATVEALLGEAAAGADQRGRPPKALIVPHAGYRYSGAIAASAYRLLEPWAQAIERVVLLGPAHRVALAGLAAPGAALFQTPLGDVPVDVGGIAALADLAFVRQSDLPHEGEHSLEVQLPFLQRLLPRFRLVPLAVGLAAPREVAAVLERLWGGPETLIVVSSDLSHYHGYAEARNRDSATSARILKLDPRLTGEEACGCRAINGLLWVAQQRVLTVELVELRNSGDTSGDRASVVGYGAYAFYPS